MFFFSIEKKNRKRQKTCKRFLPIKELKEIFIKKFSTISKILQEKTRKKSSLHRRPVKDIISIEGLLYHITGLDTRSLWVFGVDLGCPIVRSSVWLVVYIGPLFLIPLYRSTSSATSPTNFE